MENLLKLLEYAKALTWEGLVKTALFLVFMLFVATEGREVWLEGDEAAAAQEGQALGELNRDLLVTQVVPQLEEANNREEAQEAEIREIQKAFNESTTTQALIQQKLELEVKRLEDRIDQN